MLEDMHVFFLKKAFAENLTRRSCFNSREVDLAQNNLKPHCGAFQASRRLVPRATDPSTHKGRFYSRFSPITDVPEEINAHVFCFTNEMSNSVALISFQTHCSTLEGKNGCKPLFICFCFFLKGGQLFLRLVSVSFMFCHFLYKIFSSSIHYVLFFFYCHLFETLFNQGHVNRRTLPPLP